MRTADGIEVSDPEARLWYIIRSPDGYPRTLQWCTAKHHAEMQGWPLYSSWPAVVEQLNRESAQLWEEHGRLTEWLAVIERDAEAGLSSPEL